MFSHKALHAVVTVLVCMHQSWPEAQAALNPKSNRLVVDGGAGQSHLCQRVNVLGRLLRDNAAPRPRLAGAGVCSARHRHDMDMTGVRYPGHGSAWRVLCVCVIIPGWHHTSPCTLGIRITVLNPLADPGITPCVCRVWSRVWSRACMAGFRCVLGYTRFISFHVERSLFYVVRKTKINRGIILYNNNLL